MAVWSRQFFLQGGHLNWHTWKKIVHSQHLLKTKDSQVFFFFFATGPIKFRYSTMEPLDTIKPFELTWPLRKQPSNLWMLLVRLQKKLENLLWCNNTIFSQVSPVECLYCTINLYHSSISFLLLTFLFFFPIKVLQTLNVPKLNTTAIPSLLKTTKNCT